VIDVYVLVAMILIVKNWPVLIATWKNQLKSVRVLGRGKEDDR